MAGDNHHLPPVRPHLRITELYKGQTLQKEVATVPVRPPGLTLSSTSLSETMETIVTKDELRAELERQAQRYKDVYGGEVITYAAQPDPERKPWRKKTSLLDQAFDKEIEKIEKDLSSKAEARTESA